MRPAPNLLPKKLLVRRSRRVRVRRWTGVLVLELLLGVLAGLVSRYDYANPATQARDVIQATVGQIDVVTAELAEVERELTLVKQRLAVASEVAEQPDWSIVLSAIAWQGKGLALLDSTQLMAPIAQTPTKKTKDAETGQTEPAEPTVLLYRIGLIGSCQTRQDVTRFVERLEETGIFSRVRISQTQSVDDPSSTDTKVRRVAFTIEAWLADGGTS